MFHEPRVWTAVAFVLFFVIFGRKIWGIIAAKLDERANEVRKNLDEATRLRREAEQMLEDSKRDHKRAQEEAQQLIAKSNEAAEQMRAQAERDAAEIVSHHEKMARERIEAAEKIALHDILRQAAALAVTATRDVLTKKLAEDHELANKLINNGLEALPHAFGDKTA